MPNRTALTALLATLLAVVLVSLAWSQSRQAERQHFQLPDMAALNLPFSDAVLATSVLEADTSMPTRPFIPAVLSLTCELMSALIPVNVLLFATQFVSFDRGPVLIPWNPFVSAMMCRPMQVSVF